MELMAHYIDISSYLQLTVSKPKPKWLH